MEENRPFRRVLKRQKRAIRGSVNKVAQSSDVVVETLEDGSIEGIKLQYKPRYSTSEKKMTVGTLKELIDWIPMADLLKGEKHD